MFDRQSIRRWLSHKATWDRVFAFMGLLATIFPGLLRILVPAVQKYFNLVLVITIVLIVVISGPMVLLVREPKQGIDENCDGADAICGGGSDLEGIPVGPYSLNDEASALWGVKYTGGTIWTSPKKIYALLDEAQAKGVRVAISLAGFGKSDYQNPDETFNLDLWKQEVDLYDGIVLDKYIDDGTIIVHYLVDEPKSRSNWGNQVITNDILDEMARYSKVRWPNMATAVRVAPTDLAENAGGYHVPLPGWEWQYLDTAWLQYSNRKGPINAYIAAETHSAADQNLGIVAGLNVITGGDGSSGKPGPGKYSDKWTMSKDELLEYGIPLINSPTSCALLMWSYRFDNDPGYNFSYFTTSEIDAAVATLVEQGRQRPEQSCKRN